MPWFELTGSNPLDPNDYTFRSSQPGCGGEDQICAVQAAAGPGNTPVLTATLKDDMISALHSGDESDDVKLRNR